MVFLSLIIVAAEANEVEVACRKFYKKYGAVSEKNIDTCIKQENKCKQHLKEWYIDSYVLA